MPTTRDPVPEEQRRSGAALPARDHGKAEADDEPGQDTVSKVPKEEFDFLGFTNVLSDDGPSSLGIATVKEEDQAHGRQGPHTDRPIDDMTRGTKLVDGRTEPRVSRVGQLLQCRLISPGLSGARQVYSGAAAPVALQAQDQTKPGRQLIHCARASDPAWARCVVGDDVRVLSESRMQGNPHVRFDQRGVCQSAPKFDPRSASNRDLSGRFRLVPVANGRVPRASRSAPHERRSDARGRGLFADRGKPGWYSLSGAVFEAPGLCRSR
jgi:hypothetical protein